MKREYISPRTTVVDVCVNHMLCLSMTETQENQAAQRLQNKKVAHLVRQHSVAKRLGQKNRKNNRIKNSQPCKHLCKAGCF